ncbi:hypothetical protein N7532_003745 [Penicillium argentinense]|uniref:Uncharacterized protein n=1 Tax=Penicillium argentinense TaxID=1131581 RepID=A0A9W9KEU2_9EURO|nr:uncharacterized protein N7532_003745 [Penicillium argentinense]KAJ5103216.1 hypothetical protein N7532_003745 [Penicillium argentinense]
MEEIPILIENADPKIQEDDSAMEPMHRFGEKEEPYGDLSILAQDLMTPIAIIGMGFRGPADAVTVDRLWDIMMEQREGWSPIPAKRWNNAAFYHPDHAHHGTINVQGGHFLEEDISLFDAPFFNMSSDEAAAMDPQQRLLLEVTYEGLESAGISLNHIAGSRTSCFVGSFCADYTDILLRDPECVPMYQCTNAGQSRAMTANRISYFYDLKGPSVTVDTACSGSLVALHLACQSLHTGDATMAIAAGVNVILSHEFMSTMSMMRFLSPDGRCHTFDEKANGYARGEAVGCVILKPLDQALRDRDTIRAVIRGTGSNQDGRTPGITLPSATAQEALIRDLYTRAGLNPSETDVVEAHGTGTQAGDPVETGAIARVFGPGRAQGRPVCIGSIKTNVGHLEGASGIAGVIKAVLMLENRTILPSRNFETLNPRIPLEEWKLKIPLTPEVWDSAGPRRVSVNSFGYGGSNAHVILEDASGYISSRGLCQWFKKPSKAMRRKERDNEGCSDAHPERQRILLVSGFDERSCVEHTRAICDFLLEYEDTVNETLLDDLVFTLSEGRSRFMWKTAVIGSSIHEMVRSLSAGTKPHNSLRRPTLAFIFTGQGAQWAGMGKELLEAYPVFCDSISRIDSFLVEAGASFTVHDEISQGPGNSQLSHPLLSQTVCTALQIALVDLLASWNIYPDSVAGHSSGEIAAAYACGALSMEDAMRVAFSRGLAASQVLTSSDIEGAMMAVGMSCDEIRPFLLKIESGNADIACINSPSSVTISGDASAIDELAQVLECRSIFFRRLAVNVAYHSHHMKCVADEYLSAISTIKPRGPQMRDGYAQKSFDVQFFSSVTGDEIQPEELGPQYWVSNLLGQVKFSESVKSLCFKTNVWHQEPKLKRRSKRLGSSQKASVDCLLEVGPHSALSGPIKQTLQANVKLHTVDITYISVLVRKKNAVKSALLAASTLASISYPVSLDAINFPKGAKHGRVPQLLVNLPSYRWNHTRSYWAEPRLSKTFRCRENSRTELLGASDSMACPFEPRWRNFIRVSEVPWLVDHKIQSDIVFPAAAYLCMAVEAVVQITRSAQITGIVLRNVSINSALIVTEDSGIEMMTSLQILKARSTHGSETWYKFHIYSVSKDNRWTEHCTGDVGIESQNSDAENVTIRYMDKLEFLPPGSEAQTIQAIDIDNLYQRLKNVGLEYGPCFTNLARAQSTATGECFAEISIPDTASMMPMKFQHPHLIHPCTLDSIFHTAFVALPDGMIVEKGPIIPVSLEYMRLSHQMTSSPGDILSVCTEIWPTSNGDVVASIAVAEDDARYCSLNPKISINGLRCTRLAVTPGMSDRQSDVPIAYGIEWQADPTFLSVEDSVHLFELSEKTQHETLDNISTLNSQYDQCAAALVQSAVQAFKEEHYQRPGLIYDKYGSALEEMIQSCGAQHHETTEPAVDISADSQQMGRLLSAIDGYLSSITQIEEEAFAQVHDELCSAYHEVISSHPTYVSAAQHLKLIARKKPDISILQVGGAFGRPLTIFLESLVTEVRSNKTAVPSFSKYTIAHKDEGELEQIRTNFEGWAEWVDFVNIDPARSSPEIFESGLKHSYHVVIVPHGLFSFPSNTRGLSFLRSILRPGGYLIIIDSLRPKESILDAFLAASLYLWPSGNFEVPRSLQEEGGLDEAIQKAGLMIYRNETSEKDFNHLTTERMIICQPQHEMNLTEKEFLIIQDDDMNASMAVCLRKHILDVSSKVDISSLYDAQITNKFCIIFTDTHTKILSNPTSEVFNKLKEIFLNSRGMLWISRGGLPDPTFPEYGLAVGFARTARSESAVKPILTLDLDAQNPLPEFKVAKIIVRLIQYSLCHVNAGDMDTEYVERNGVLLIPRVVERADVNRSLLEINKSETQREQLFREPESPVRVSRPDAKNVPPHLVGEPDMGGPPAGHVRIEVMAFALSEWDVDETTQNFRTEKTPGLECSGRVEAVGAGVGDLAVGDRVACLGNGTARSYYQDRESAFQKIEDAMTYELAVSLPVPYTSAYFVIHYLARVKPNETVLIRRAASWIGEALLDICLSWEVDVLVTVTTLAEKEVLRSRFSIQAHRIFVEGMDDVARCVSDLTNSKKCQVVITSSEDGSERYRSLSNVVATFGHLVRVRSPNESAGEDDSLSGSLKNVSRSIFNILDFLRDQMDLARYIWSKVVRLFHEGRLRGPSSLSVYGVTDVEEAFAALGTEKHVVIATDGNEVVTVSQPKPPTTLFRSDASYLLIGGLGGIGSTIALWMADQGARNLVLVNRSGLATEASHSLVRDLSDKGVRQMFLDILWGAPPVRGIVHGAMILKDVHIEKMTSYDYFEVLRPRYNGTWNLHRHAPADLDFFLMLSSISGVIGNATQAAYAAGSAFMDSFAAYRNTLGLPAISLDLGTVTDVGYLAANKELATKMARQGFQGTDKKTLLSLIQVAISQPTKVGNAQIITGLGEWKEGESLGNFDAPLFAQFRVRFRRDGETADSKDAVEILRGSLRASKSQDEAIPVIYEALSGKISTRLGISVERIDPASPLSEFGVDSHVAVELRNWINKTMDSAVSILEILASDSVLQLVGHIAGRSSLIEGTNNS